MRIWKLIAVVFIVSIIFNPGFSYAQESSSEASTETPVENPGTSAQEQRRQYEDQLIQLEKEQAELQKTIEGYQKEGKTLNNEISTINARINKIKLQIKSVNVTLSKLGQEIIETQKNINQTENKIDTHRNAIGRSLQNLREADKQTVLTIVMGNSKLSDFFQDINNVLLVQDNIRGSLEEVTRLRQNLLAQKEELSAEKEDTENLRAIQLAQQKQTEAIQKEKNTILKTTKGKESEYQKLLRENQAKAAEIRSRIFELLGGGQLTFEKAYNYAKLAESATGVRAALTLAILDRESKLGKNVGQCTYKTAMHPTRDIPYFLDLLSRLGIDANSEAAKVSCAITAHGSYGGAMGPAQFIPSTWKMYEAKIAKVSGNNPPNPWNNADAFTATAVYMQDLLDSASCKDYANSNKHLASYDTLLERCAAAKYYSGARWYTYRFFYGEPVVTKANQFEKDISIIVAKN